MVSQAPTDSGTALALFAAAVYEARIRPDAAQWINAALFGTLRALGENLVGTTLGSDLIKIVDDLGGTMKNPLFVDGPVKPTLDDAPPPSTGNDRAARPESGRMGTGSAQGAGPNPAALDLVLVPPPGRDAVAGPSTPAGVP